MSRINFEAYRGARVKIRLRANFEGRRNFTGRLTGVEDGDVILQLDDENEIVVPLENVDRANVVPEFDDKSK